MSIDPKPQIAGQIYMWRKFVKYTGPVIASEDLELPAIIKIEPWEPLPIMAVLTINDVIVAGPARLKLLRSFAHQLCTDHEKIEELATIREEVDTAIQKKVQ